MIRTVLVLASSALLAVPAAATIDLGSAAQFAILAGSAISSTDGSAITGSIGVAPAGAITILSPGTVSGTVHTNDAIAAAAQADLGVAYDAAAAPQGGTLLSPDLGGLTLTPGVYRFAAAAQLTGTLRLDALGDPTAMFLFQIGSALTTATDSAVVLFDGADAGNVFFQVGSSATLGAGTDFAGTILAQNDITLGGGAAINGGRALALDGGVTLIDNVVALPVPAAVVPPVGTVPEPQSWLLLVTGFGLVGVVGRARSRLRFT